MARAIVDTGAVVALINRDDRHHPAAVEWFKSFRGKMLTTEAVITETAYVLAASPAHQRAALGCAAHGRARSDHRCACVAAAAFVVIIIGSSSGGSRSSKSRNSSSSSSGSKRRRRRSG